MLDHFIYGTVERISPEAPVPVVKAEYENNTLGGCGNVIRNLRNLQVNVIVVTAVGSDMVGEVIKTELAKLDIDTLGVVNTNDIHSTHKMRVIAENQHITRVDWDAAHLSINDYKIITRLLENCLANANGIIVSDYGKGVCQNDIVQAIIKKAKRKRIPVFIDPKGKDWGKYSGAFCITPNAKEAQEALNENCGNDDDFANIGNRICKEFNIDNCLITRGKDGMSLINKKGVHHIPSQAKEVFDVSGAGDTVIACLAAAVIAGEKLKTAVEFANAAASVVVGHVGTAAITIEELERL